MLCSHSLQSRPGAWGKKGAIKLALAGTSKGETEKHCNSLLTHCPADEVMQLVEGMRAKD